MTRRGIGIGLDQQGHAALVDTVAHSLWRTAPDGLLLEISDAWLELVGCRREDALGWGWLEAVHPEDRDRCARDWAAAVERGERFAHETRVCCSNGEVRWFDNRATPITDASGDVVEWVGAALDITAMKEAEASLQYVSGLQRTLVEISREVVGAAGPDLDRLINDALARVGRYCRADRSYMFRFTEGFRTHVNTHEWCAPGIRPQITEMNSVDRSALPALVDTVAGERVVHIPDVGALDDSWAAERAFFRRHGIRAVVVVPVVNDEGVYGQIGFDSTATPRAWSDEEIHMLRGLADLIGTAIARDRVERVMRENEARLRALAEHMPGDIYQRIRTPDGYTYVSYVSPSIEPVFGIDAQRIMADPEYLLERIHPDDREGYLAAIETSARDMTLHDVQFRMRGDDGVYRWGRSVAHPRRGKDGSIIWDGIAIDESERRRAEEQLEQTRMLLDIAGWAARLGGWRADLDNGRVIWSEQVCAIHGMPVGTTLAVDEGIRFYAPEYRDHISRVFEQCAQEGIPFDEELQIVTADGERVWVRSIGRAVRDGSGRIVEVRGAFQDISQQKQAQAEIERLARRLTNTLESITDAFFIVDRDWRFTYLNRQAENLLHASREQLLGEVVWDAFPAARGANFEHEYRRAMRDGCSVDFEAYYPPLDTWFEVHAYPSEEGLAVYFRDVTERRRAREEIEFLALYDPLTRLPNRRLLLDRLQNALATRAREGCNGALLFLDLDNFKNLNDTLGHGYGDRLLQEVATRLTGTLRETDTVARFGGDEFAVVIGDLDRDAREAIRQAEGVGQKMLAALTEPYRLAEHERHLTVSIGITLFGDADDTADDLMQRVDLAMYQAKNAGRGTLRTFDPAMRTAMQSRVNLEADLRHALEHGQIVAHFQPQVSADRGIVGAEALARWTHPERGVVSPGEFIPVAEETGLILPLGERMLEVVCERLAAWKEDPVMSGLGVAVNVSARQFHHPAFFDTVRGVLERTGTEPRALCLELTESLLLADVADTVGKLERLRELGLRFSLDDFGTGYSSLAYLKRLPLDQLKIDQSFVRDALIDRNDVAIVRTIIVLARTLGLDVIAEGVENEELRAMLARHGCTTWQGFHFAHPMPAPAFEQWVADHRSVADWSVPRSAGSDLRRARE